METMNPVHAAKTQLALEFNCSAADFDSGKLVITPSTLHPKRRYFGDQPVFFKMISFGCNCVISADPVLAEPLTRLCAGMEPGELFMVPNLVRMDALLRDFGFRLGPTHELYLQRNSATLLTLPDFEFLLIQREGIPELYLHPGFANALQYDTGARRPDILACLARHEGKIAGIAAASRDTDRLWQIGIDVCPEFRRRSLGTALVQKLTQAIHEAGAIPYYGTWNGNISSRNICNKAGYLPCWIENYSVLP